MYICFQNEHNVIKFCGYHLANPLIGTDVPPPKEVADKKQSPEHSMLEFENVSKSFWTGTQRKVILDRVSFKVELGNSMGILAPNGTGKTTLINMMAGLEKPDEGVIRRKCNISFPLGFMGGVVGKVSASRRATTRQTARPLVAYVDRVWKRGLKCLPLLRR
jgi:ABC-type glutathione transport system ATPase component